MLWLEMIIRDAAIYVCVFFLPLTFVAMIWPATSRWARRLVELLVAIILAKFVIVSILSLATAAIANTDVVNGDGADVRADDRRRGAARPRRLVAVRAPATDPDDGESRRRASSSQRSSMSARRRIGRHPEPRRLHAPGDGPQLTAVDVARRSDNDQRNDLRAARTRRSRSEREHDSGRIGDQASAARARRATCPNRPRGLRRARRTRHARRPAHRHGEAAERFAETLARHRRRLRAQPTPPAESPPPTPAARPASTAMAVTLSTSEHRRYRFGPLERRGLIGSLRPAQVLVIAASLTAGVDPDARAARAERASSPRSRSPSLAVAFCFWPIAGRSAEEWLPVVARHALRRAADATSSYRRAPQAGARPAPTAGRKPIVALPERRRATSSCSPRRSTASTVGVVKDRRARTYTAALAVRVTSFGLLDRAEQESAPGRLGRRPRGPRPRGQPGRAGSSGSSAPCRPTATRSAATSARRGTATPCRSTRCRCSPTSSSTSTAPAVTTDHELFVCLQIDAKRAWRQIKRAGGKDGADAGACAVLLRELEALAERLAAADVRVVGALRPGMLARRDPRRVRPVVAARASRASPPPTRSATASTRPPPGRWQPKTSWGVYRTDGAVPRDLLDRGLAANRCRRRLPVAAAPARADGAGDRR